MAFRIQLRRDTSLKWSINNPVLLEGEIGYETNTMFLKIGDGTTPWNSLPYWSGGLTGSGLVVKKNNNIVQSPTYTLNFSNNFSVSPETGNVVDVDISEDALLSNLDVYLNGSIGATGVTAFNFSGNVTPVTISGKTVNLDFNSIYQSFVGYFSVTVNLNGGDFFDIDSSRGPDGLPLTGSPWNFILGNSGNNITVTHNTGARPISLSSHGKNGSNVFVRYPFGISTSNFTLVSSSNYNSFTLYGVNSSNTGAGPNDTVDITCVFGATQ